MPFFVFWRQILAQKRGICPYLDKFPQIVGNGFQTELDFCSSHPLKSKSPELAAFLDLTKHRLGLYRTVAPMLQPLFTCKQFSYSCFVIIKCVVYLYLSVAFWFMTLSPKWTSLASGRPINTDCLLVTACRIALFLSDIFYFLSHRADIKVAVRIVEKIGHTKRVISVTTPLLDMEHVVFDVWSNAVGEHVFVVLL